MAAVAVKSIDKPDELRRLPNGSLTGAIVDVHGMTVMRAEMAPGWRWSNDVRPVAGTASCEFEHHGSILGGTLHVEMDDGSSVDLKAGDVYIIPPGHDAWVVGDEPVRLLDWTRGNVEFAKPKKA